MSNGLQEHVFPSSPGRVFPAGGAEVPFDHAVEGLGLPELPVVFLVGASADPAPHETPVAAF